MTWGERCSVLHFCAGDMLHIQVGWGESVCFSIKHISWSHISVQKWSQRDLFCALLCFCQVYFYANTNSCIFFHSCAKSFQWFLEEWILFADESVISYIWKWPCLTWIVVMALTVVVKVLHWSERRDYAVKRSDERLSVTESHHKLGFTPA